jgi:predicted PurR-regulated permease PerM
MIALLLPLLVALVVFGLAWWAVRAVLKAFGIGDPIATLVHVVFVVLVVLWLVQRLGFSTRLF